MAEPCDNIYMTGLPSDINQEQLRTAFEQIFPVVHCKLLPTNGGNRAAFVRFQDADSATAIMDNYKGCCPPGLTECTIGMEFSPNKSPQSSSYGKANGKGASKGGEKQRSTPYNNGTSGNGAEGGPEPLPSVNLYVTDLPEVSTQEDVETAFCLAGTVVSTKILGAWNGYAAAMVRMASVQEAAAAIEMLNGGSVEGYGKPLKVQFASQRTQTRGMSNVGVVMEPLSVPRHLAGGVGWSKGAGGAKGYSKAANGGKGAGGDEASLNDMSKIVNMFVDSGALPETGQGNVALYISGLTRSCTDLHLYQLFAPFGAIAPRGVRCMTNPDGTARGIGFVDFLDMGSAQNAISVLSGAELPDGTILMVKLKAPARGGKGK